MKTPAMRIVIGIVIGLVGYELAALTNAQIPWVAATPDAIVLLVLFIATAITGGMLAAPGPAAASTTTRPASGAPQGRPAAASTTASGNETGTVKWFNVKKGYGFITRDQGDDVFVHYRNIKGEGRRSVGDGERVSFRVVEGDKGPQAEDVEPLAS